MTVPQTSRAHSAADLTELAAEFPAYEFATQQTWDGTSIVARRHGGCTRPGLYAIVTADPDEMSRALIEHAATRDPASAVKGDPGCLTPRPGGGRTGRALAWL